MRAMAVAAYGDPLREVDWPEPTLGPGTALLGIVTCGVCASDLKTARGHMPFRDEVALPHVPGHEVVGRVLATDPVGALEAGRLVTVFHSWPCGGCGACRRGDDALCADVAGWVGFRDPGGFRERMTAPLDRLVPIPEGIDPVRAAPLSCAIGTAYRAVVTRGAVVPGSTVLVVGLGGVGLHAAQIAQTSGALTLGVDPHGPTREAARALGIAAYLDLGAARDEALAAGAGAGVDVAIDTVGDDETLGDAAALVRRGGRLVVVGYGPTSRVRLETSRLVLDEIAVVGSRYARRDEIERAARLVADGLVEPVIGAVAPLGAANDVLDDLEAGRIVGRAVLTIADDLHGNGSEDHETALGAG